MTKPFSKIGLATRAICGRPTSAEYEFRAPAPGTECGEFAAATVAEAGSYTANVQWANPIGEREVTVHLGETTASGTLGENEDEILFTGLKLSAGNADFRVDYSGEQSRQNTPRFLRISRKP